jgi:hypothetical protein
MGHPGQGQTSTEIRHDGHHTRKKDTPGFDGQAQGGSGLRDEGNVEARRLARETTEHEPLNAREHNITYEGAEDKLPTSSEEVAAMRE